MSVQLTQKEQMLLKDQKSHEELCVKKYQDYAQRAQDQELKNLFNSYSQQEQTHLNSINQMLSGQIPQVSQGQQSQQNQQSQQSTSQQSNTQAGNYNQNDADLCTHMLMTEKYVSSAYNTAIFEFTNSQMRQVLNHIQKEEQQHGEGIFNYMQQKGMYNVQ